MAIASRFVYGWRAAPEFPTPFQDNFDGEILDSTKWKIGQHWAGINGAAQPNKDNLPSTRACSG